MDMLDRLKKLNASYFDNWISTDGQLVGNETSNYHDWKHSWYYYGNNQRMDCLDWQHYPDFRDIEFCGQISEDLTFNNIECGQMQVIGPMRFICKRNTRTSG
jgi:hypothetical protein